MANPRKEVRRGLACAGTFVGDPFHCDADCNSCPPHGWFTIHIGGVPFMSERRTPQASKSYYEWGINNESLEYYKLKAMANGLSPDYLDTLLLGRRNSSEEDV